jgi:hypothetical protein
LEESEQSAVQKEDPIATMLRRAVTAHTKRLLAGRRSVRRLCTVSDDEDNMLDAFSRTVVGVVEKASDILPISAHAQPRQGC